MERHKYENATKSVDEIEHIGFGRAGELCGALTHALYESEVVDRGYRETLDDYGFKGARPWTANVESLDLRATLAMLTWVYLADLFCGGAMAASLKDGFVYRILLYLRELDDGRLSHPALVGFWKVNE